MLVCGTRVRFRSAFWQLHASAGTSYASSYADRCELWVQQWYGWVLGQCIAVIRVARRVD